MILNKEALISLIDNEFDGSVYKAAMSFGLSYSGLFKLINYNRKAGLKTITAIIDFCGNNNLNYTDYIFF